MPSSLRVSATRPWVDAFADEMESRLEQNRHKGDREGWNKDDPLALLERLKQELAELEGVLWGHRDEGGLDDEVRHEAADVANFAMMIADVAGGMKPSERAAALERERDALRAALNTIAYEPIGEPEASVIRVCSDIVAIARAALAESP